MNDQSQDSEDRSLGGRSFARRLADEVLRRLDEELLDHPALLRRLRLDLIRSSEHTPTPAARDATQNDMKCREPEDSISHPDTGPEWIHASERDSWAVARWSGTVRSNFPSIRSFLSRLPAFASRRAVIVRNDESNGTRWVHVFYPKRADAEPPTEQPHWECVSLQDYSVMGAPSRLGRMLCGLKNSESAKIIEERTSDHSYVHVFFEVSM